MKKLLAFLMVFVIGASVYAQIQIPDRWMDSAYWQFRGDRLFGTSENARLAKVNLVVPQSGAMIYEFNVRYESGAEDGHGGFGIHIFADQALNRNTWGAGKSYLLWLNYDENPRDPKIPKGLSAQVYRSVTHTYMELVESISLSEYERFLTPENLSKIISFKITADGDTGEIRVYDPTDAEGRNYFLYTINPRDIPLKGDYVVLRTNGMRLSFAME